jgi:hypothetical protein
MLRAPVALQIRTQFRIVIGDALREGHHQGDRVVSDLPRAVVRHIADRNAQLAETLDVDVVVADAVLHEDAAGLQLVDVWRRAPADDRVRLRPLLADHDRRRIGVARVQRRHNWGIGDPQPRQAAYTKLVVDHRHRVHAMLGGPGGKGCGDA